MYAATFCSFRVLPLKGPAEKPLADETYRISSSKTAAFTLKSYFLMCGAIDYESQCMEDMTW